MEFPMIWCGKTEKHKTTSCSGFEKVKPQDNVFLKIRQALKVDGFVSKMWITFS